MIFINIIKKINKTKAIIYNIVFIFIILFYLGLELIGHFFIFFLFGFVEGACFFC